MLSQDEIHYIQTIPEEKVVVIKPYSQKQSDIADTIIAKAHNAFPQLRIIHMGASGLRILGQGDIDVYVLASPDMFSTYLPGLELLFGKPKTQRPDSIAWEFEIDGYPIELYLTDPTSDAMRRQIKVFTVLSSDPELCQSYERLKSAMNGTSFREYQKKKYEFYHKILGE